MKKRLGLLLLTTSILGCATQPPGLPVHPENACTPGTVGMLRVMGGEGPSQPVLVEDGGDSFLLTGAGVEGLQRLSGGRVEVCGSVLSEEGPLRGGRIEVRSFRLLEMDGQPAYLGTLTREGRAYALELCSSESVLRLRSVPARFEELMGAVIWIAGRSDGGRLEVLSFGTAEERTGGEGSERIVCAPPD